MAGRHARTYCPLCIGDCPEAACVCDPTLFAAVRVGPPGDGEAPSPDPY
jgi:hypothetical protein